MAKGVFNFKRFAVEQDLCGMKVGTDGVLLGAWAGCGGNAAGERRDTADGDGGCTDSRPRVLDIGTGTGLIALMMAQRFPNALVDGIDIDPAACRQASVNASKSPFASRIAIANTRLQDFFPTIEYDCIVSNPPYYDGTLRCPDERRATARHTDTLPFAELLHGVCRLLKPGGLFSVVLPTDCLNRFLAEAVSFHLRETRRCLIRTAQNKEPKRVLLTFGIRLDASGEGDAGTGAGALTGIEETVETLANADGSRSKWYDGLTRDFYLARP